MSSEHPNRLQNSLNTPFTCISFALVIMDVTRMSQCLKSQVIRLVIHLRAVTSLYEVVMRVYRLIYFLLSVSNRWFNLWRPLNKSLKQMTLAQLDCPSGIFSNRMGNDTICHLEKYRWVINIWSPGSTRPISQYCSMKLLELIGGVPYLENHHLNIFSKIWVIDIYSSKYSASIVECNSLSHISDCLCRTMMG